MKLSLASGVSLLAAVFVGAICSACTKIDDAAQVVVIVGADLSVRERVSSVDVELLSSSRGSQTWDKRITTHFSPKPSLGAWPLQVALPGFHRGATDRLEVTATARDADDVVLAQVRAVSDSPNDGPLELTLRFDPGCAADSGTCGPVLSCHGGMCDDAGALPDAASPNDASAKSPPGACDGGANCAPPENDCGADRGGCDPLAGCSRVDGKAVCGVCPVGFAGSGSTGCTATLLDLKVSDATLQPAFDPANSDYTVVLPLLPQAFALQPSAAAGVTVRIEGLEIAARARWTGPLPAIGDARSVMLTTSAPDHAGRTYKLTLQRAVRTPAALKAQNPSADDQLGYAMALSGDTVVAGAPYEDGGAGSRMGHFDDAAKDSGAAYVFVRSGTTWVQQAYLKADAVVAGAKFGVSVAIDGDRIAVGARNDTGSGAVYMFERSAGAWQQTDALRLETATQNIAFGAALALHGDQLAIGAVGESDGATESGAVFLYQHSATGWTRVGRLKAATPGPLDWLGSSIAFDSDLLVTGATGQFVDGNPCGAVHVYVRSSNTWQEQGILPANSLEAGALFGTSVAISSGTVAVGAFNGTAGLTSGAVFVFVRESAGTFRQEAVVRAANPESGDYFGLQLALSGDQLLVGASRQSAPDVMGASLTQAGAAYLFGREAGIWRQTAQLRSSPALAQQQFGYGVAFEGETIAVTALGDGTGSSGANSGALLIFE